MPNCSFTELSLLKSEVPAPTSVATLLRAGQVSIVGLVFMVNRGGEKLRSFAIETAAPDSDSQWYVYVGSYPGILPGYLIFILHFHLDLKISFCRAKVMIWRKCRSHRIYCSIATAVDL